MEEVLDVYARPYDPDHPVVGLDESPQQLIGECREGFTDSKGVEHVDYEYTREGTVDLYMVVEPFCEELGVVGAASVIFLYLGLIVCGLAIVNRTVHPFQAHTLQIQENRDIAVLSQAVLHLVKNGGFATATFPK